MKVVINACHGGFGLSAAACKLLELEPGGRGWEYCDDESRAAPELVRVVEELGKRASDDLAALKVVEIPDGIEWELRDYDGVEEVVETGRTWS